MAPRHRWRPARGLPCPKNMTLRKASEADARAMARLLRDSDREELLASSGGNRFAERLARAVAVSCEAWLLSAASGPLCLFGLAPTDLKDTGSPWLVGAQAMDSRPMALARLGRQAVYRFNRRFPVLMNWVHAPNVRALRFAEWLGFERFPAAPHGPLGRPFHRILRRRQPCANPQPSSP